MSKPHTCPVCSGTGRVFRPPYNTTYPTWDNTTHPSWQYTTTGTAINHPGDDICPACHGSCVVWEPQSYQPYWPPCVQPYSPPQIIEWREIKPVETADDWCDILKKFGLEIKDE